MLTMNPLWRDPAIRNAVQARSSHREPVLRNRVSIARLATTQPLQVVQRLVAQRAVLRPQSHAPSTLAKYASADTYFYEFCQHLGISFLRFGAPPSQGGYSVEEEDNILELLPIFVCEAPRVHGKPSNSGDYAGGILSGTRYNVYSRHKRDVGTPVAENRGLRDLMRSLRKAYPSVARPPRLPILQDTMRAVLATLDPNNGRHRVYAALWTTCWQAVCRCGDLLRRKHRGGAPWDPAWDMGRDRFTLAEADVPGFPDVNIRATYRLPPGKTDPTGARHLHKTLLVDQSPSAISGAYHTSRMLLLDPLLPGEDPAMTPLFRDPTTGLEITYEHAKEALTRHLTLAGRPDLARGLHTLRGGGGTALNDEAGAFVAAAAGHWKSNAKFDYFYSLRNSTEMGALRMSRGDAGPLADPSGPALSHKRQRR